MEYVKINRLILVMVGFFSVGMLQTVKSAEKVDQLGCFSLANQKYVDNFTQDKNAAYKKYVDYLNDVCVQYKDNKNFNEKIELLLHGALIQNNYDDFKTLFQILKPFRDLASGGCLENAGACNRLREVGKYPYSAYIPTVVGAGVAALPAKKILNKNYLDSVRRAENIDIGSQLEQLYKKNKLDYDSTSIEYELLDCKNQLKDWKSEDVEKYYELIDLKSENKFKSSEKHSNLIYGAIAAATAIAAYGLYNFHYTWSKWNKFEQFKTNNSEHYLNQLAEKFANFALAMDRGLAINTFVDSIWDKKENTGRLKGSLRWLLKGVDKDENRSNSFSCFIQKVDKNNTDLNVMFQQCGIVNSWFGGLTTFNRSNYMHDEYQLNIARFLYYNKMDSDFLKKLDDQNRKPDQSAAE